MPHLSLRSACYYVARRCAGITTARRYPFDQGAGLGERLPNQLPTQLTSQPPARLRTKAPQQLPMQQHPHPRAMCGLDAPIVLKSKNMLLPRMPHLLQTQPRRVPSGWPLRTSCTVAVAVAVAVMVVVVVAGAGAGVTRQQVPQRTPPGRQRWSHRPRQLLHPRQRGAPVRDRALETRADQERQNKPRLC